MRTFVMAVVTLVGLLATGCPPAAVAATWDDFKSKKLDPTKWMGDQSSSPGAIALEARREIVGGKLLVSHRASGDAGGGSSTNRLVFRNTSPFTSIQYTVKINAISTTDCAGPRSVASVFQFNYLFSTNDSSVGIGCESVTCNVFAVFYMDHISTDAANNAQVHGRVVARRADNGQEVTLGTSGEFGAVKKGTPVTVSLVWDDGASTVTYGVTVKKLTQTHEVDYGALSKAPVAAPLNTIEVGESVCGPDGVAESSASWDNIVVTP